LRENKIKSKKSYQIKKACIKNITSIFIKESTQEIHDPAAEKQILNITQISICKMVTDNLVSKYFIFLGARVSVEWAPRRTCLYNKHLTIQTGYICLISYYMREKFFGSVDIK
jgi:hypothetical protein